MKQNYKISLCALLLVGAVNTMTIGALGADKPKLAVFVVGMDNALGNTLATQLGSELNRNSRYTVATNDAAVQSKLADLRKQDARSIDKNALAAWGQTNSISAICLVTDGIIGNDHMFYAQLIDAKNSKLEGRGSYTRTNVVAGDVTRIALVLAQQLSGSERRHSAPAPARSYPAELDIEMVFVEGGTFTMGCDEQIGDCSASEKPVHAVTLTQDFWIGKYEVTRALWLAVMAGHPTLSNSGNWRDDDQLPIEKVSYYDVIGSDGFFARLNAQTGKKYRLPTEAEWEYVARGGKHKSPYKYSGSNDLNEVGWYTGNSGGKTHVVGGKKPNALGVYDMSGNVWEYCSDWHGTYPSDAQTNPTGPESGTQVILRGGYINCSVISGRVTIRGNPLPTAGNNDHGFRVVLPAQ